MEYKLLVFFSGMLILKKHNGMCSLLFLKAKEVGKCLPLGFSYFLHYQFQTEQDMGFFVVRMEKKQNRTNQGALEF